MHGTKITEVNLFAFVYRLFHEDFSSIYGTYIHGTYTKILEVHLFAFAYRLFLESLCIKAPHQALYHL